MFLVWITSTLQVLWGRVTAEEHRTRASTSSPTRLGWAGTGTGGGVLGWVKVGIEATRVHWYRAVGDECQKLCPPAPLFPERDFQPTPVSAAYTLRLVNESFPHAI